MSTTPVGTPDPDNQNFDNVRVLRPLDRSTPCAVCETPQTACEQLSQQHNGIRCCGRCTHPQPGGELEPAPEVIEAELLTAEQSAELDRRLAAQAITRLGKGSAQVARVARHVATHDTTKTVGKAVVVHGVTTARGVHSWTSRGVDAATMGVYRRQIRAAQATGDKEALAEWTDRLRAERERRHQRLLNAPKLVAGAAKALAGSLAALVVLILLVGMLVQVTGTGEFLDVITGVLSGIRFTFAAIAFLWHPLLWASPLLVGAAAWREGRRRGDGPAWLRTSAEDTDIEIDERTITLALAALRIPEITAYLKQGLPMQYLTGARTDGRGTHAVLRLPPPVTAERVAKRRPDIAAALHRRTQEVWLTTGNEAGILDLWVADKGALAEGAGPFPLLTEGQADVFKGVPLGKTLRGEPITLPVIGRNTIVGGMPDQGKSSVARVVMAGCALDPTVELRIWVPDSNFDFEAFKRRCSRYVMGAEPEKLELIAADLEELVEEIQVRGEKLIEYKEEQVTRALASKNVGMHPIVALLEEAHLAFGDAEVGKRIADAAETIVRLGRKRGIHLIVSTQATTGNSVPVGITMNCANGIAFAVSRWQENDALLGQGAYAAGHRATDLIPGVDKGNAVVKGCTGARSAVAQAHYISPSKGRDQVTPIITRALALIERRGEGVPGANTPRGTADTARDLLEDLDAVMDGDESVNVADLPGRLRAHAPRYAGYKKLTGKQLREQLASEYGIKVPSTNRAYPVDPVTIREALAKQATADLDDDE
jgi:S-DNA-T family DNA segregation ATPase FtsK/SpoIIIE